MSAINEKSLKVSTTDIVESKTPSTNVLTITRPTPSRQASGVAVMSTIDDIDSTHSLSPSTSVRNEKSFGVEHPYYNSKHTESKQNIHVVETDLEAQHLSPMNSQAYISKTSLIKKTTRSDPAWPNPHELKMRKKALKRERAYCPRWAGMSKTKRGVITSIIVLVVLGAAIGIGYGVSRRVGGGVVTKTGSNTPLPS